MKAALLLLLAVCLLSVYASPRRARQTWNFPDENETSQSPSNRPNRPTTTRRTTTTPRTPGGSTTPTPAPGIIFQIEGCDCLAPPQYNPVCGTDGNTYGNMQKLNCARQCGSNVQFDRLGVCQTPRR